MEKKSWMRNQGGGGIIEEESWRGVMEEESLMRKHEVGNHVRGIMKRVSEDHLKGISEACGSHLGVIWEASRSHLGGIWEASGSHLGSIWEPSGRHLGAEGAK